MTLDHRAHPPPKRVLVALCITEIASWGVLYYAFPVMLSAVAADTGWSTGTTLSAYSAGLLASAVAAAPVGRLLERHGPRMVMTTGSVLGVGALLAVASARSLPWLFIAWVGVGLAQAMLLYPPAFAALTRWYGPDRLRAITILSLVAGLASTVFAPATAQLLTVLSWRQTLVVLAVALAVLTIPPLALLLTPQWHGEDRPQDRSRVPAISATARSRPFVLLVLAMTMAAFGVYGATMNIVPMLTGQGLGNELAATAFSMVGVGQVLGRLGYSSLTRRTAPPTRTAALLAGGAFAIVALGVVARPVAALVAVAMCAGAARGCFTLLQATAVSDRWGTARYATLNGIAIAPVTAATALAPAGTALLAESLGYPPAYCLLAALTLAGAAIACGTQVVAVDAVRRSRTP